MKTCRKEIGLILRGIELADFTTIFDKFIPLLPMAESMVAKFVSTRHRLSAPWTKRGNNYRRLWLSVGDIDTFH
jgi:hypothetical protein